MNICIIGDGLTSLSLAQNLINKKINVDIYRSPNKNNLSANRTIGVSRTNLEFFKKEILDINKNAWKINKIEIYSEKSKDEKILNFEKEREPLFFMIRNNQVYESLNYKLKKSKFCKSKIIKGNNFYQKLLDQNKYNLIINCDPKNFISKKFFSRKIDKNYNNYACTTILKHNTIRNNVAIQIFTKYGPIAFLPISSNETSVVYSLDDCKKKYDENKIIELIKKYNPKFKIKNINKLDKFQLSSSNVRNYYYKNIVAFGDCLHKIHPLAGQGFNMTIRDIQVISEIIQDRISLGLELDPSIFYQFEKKTKHFNFLFSKGVDLIYEFFNFERKVKNQSLNRIIKFFGENKKLNNIIIKFANRGINV
jgi:2-octaprenyl-6-methoxyphenol hydroxylase